MRRKRILITGGAGFIGSHLALALNRAGHEVCLLDKFSFQVHQGRKGTSEILAASGEHFEVRRGDVGSKQDLLAALSGKEVVYHFAAAVGVGQSMYQIKSYVDNNDLGTANLLQVLIRHPIERLIVASSMSIYGEGLYRDETGRLYGEVTRDYARLKQRQWDPCSANGHPLVPVPTPETKRPSLASIYALTKYDQEQMCLITGRAYRIPTVALRFFNVYGRGQALSNPYTGVVAIFASRILRGQPPLIFEDGEQKRDFVHVSDVAQACVLALECPAAAGKVFNVGSGQVYTINQVAAHLAQTLTDGKPIAPLITNQCRVGDVRHCFADISLACSILGYNPAIALPAGLEDLAEWLKSSVPPAEDPTEKAHEELLANGLAI